MHDGLDLLPVKRDHVADLVFDVGACYKWHALAQGFTRPTQHIQLLGVTQVVDIAGVHVDGVHQSGAMGCTQVLLKGLDRNVAIGIVWQQCGRNALHFALKLPSFYQCFDRHS